MARRAEMTDEIEYGDYGEPWTYRTPLGSNNGVRLSDERFAGDLYHPYGKRAVECVNTLAGIKDPAAYLEELREKAANWDFACERAVE